MNLRIISAVIFSIIVTSELIIFLTRPVPEKVIQTGQRLQGQLFPPTKIEADYDAQRNANIQYGILIGATVLIGTVVTFSLPLYKNTSSRYNN